MCNFLYLVSIVAVLFKIVHKGSPEDTKLQIREVRSPAICMFLCQIMKPKTPSKPGQIPPGQFQPQTMQGIPQTIPGQFQPQTIPGQFQPQTMQGIPQTIPGQFQPQTIPGQFQPQTIPGQPQTIPGQPQPQRVPPSEAYNALPCPAGIRQIPFNGDYIAAYPTECHYFYNCHFQGSNYYNRIVFRCPPNYYFSKINYKCELAATAEACYGPPQSTPNFNYPPFQGLPGAPFQGDSKYKPAFNAPSEQPSGIIPYDDKAGENVSNIVELKRTSVAVSKGKLSWVDAITRCEKSGLRLMILDVQQDVTFFNEAKFLKEKPYDATTRFWSAGKMVQNDGDTMSLYWEPIHREFANYTDDRSNLIEKKWDGITVTTTEEEVPLCIDVQFPASANPPRWSASDCLDKRHYICTQTPQDRIPEKSAALSSAVAQIVDDKEDED